MKMTCCTTDRVEALRKLPRRYGLVVETVPDRAPIPGSWFGEPEAGLIGDKLLVRGDTPLHSALHESCHYVCMDGERRRRLHTDAGGGYDEENGVCYLQVILSDLLPGYGRETLFREMDAWGYSFRLGSARAWFLEDAEDARNWLLDHNLLDAHDRPTWNLRE
jgi:hypothetical protein